MGGLLQSLGPEESMEMAEQPTVADSSPVEPPPQPQRQLSPLSEIEIQERNRRLDDLLGRYTEKLGLSAPDKRTLKDLINQLPEDKWEKVCQDARTSAEAAMIRKRSELDAERARKFKDAYDNVNRTAVDRDIARESLDMDTESRHRAYARARNAQSSFDYFPSYETYSTLANIDAKIAGYRSFKTTIDIAIDREKKI